MAKRGRRPGAQVNPVWAVLAQRALEPEAEEKLQRRVIVMLVMRYGLHGVEPMTYEAIGQEYGLSRERIRQLTMRGLRKLLRPGEDMLKSTRALTRARW